MEHEQIKRLAEERLRVLNLLCGALAASVVLYAGLAWFAVRAVFFEPPLGSEGGYLPQLLALLGFLPLILAPLVSAGLLKRIPSPEAGASPEGTLHAFQTATIVGFALRESGALVGLVLTLLTGELFWALALGGAALVAMMMGWPRRDQLYRLLGLGPV